MVEVCPNCGRRYSKDPHSGDFIHRCDDLGDASNAVTQEDVVWFQRTVVDNFNNDNTTITQLGKPLLNGAVNKAQFTTAGVEEGEDVEDETKRGVRKSTHRTREHFEHIG